ncbi:MAG: GTPase [Endozoicomonas sp.]
MSKIIRPVDTTYDPLVNPAPSEEPAPEAGFKQHSVKPAETAKAIASEASSVSDIKLGARKIDLLTKLLTLMVKALKLTDSILSFSTTSKLDNAWLTFQQGEFDKCDTLVEDARKDNLGILPANQVKTFSALLTAVSSRKLSLANQAWLNGDQNGAFALIKEARTPWEGKLPDELVKQFSSMLDDVKPPYMGITNMGGPRPAPDDVVILGRPGVGKSTFINALIEVSGDKEAVSAKESAVLEEGPRGESTDVQWPGKEMKMHVDTLEPQNQQGGVLAPDDISKLAKADEALYLLRGNAARLEKEDQNMLKLFGDSLVVSGKKTGETPNFSKVRFVLTQVNQMLDRPIPNASAEGKIQWLNDRFSEWLSSINETLQEHFPGVAPVEINQLSAAGYKPTLHNPEERPQDWVPGIYQVGVKGG